MRMRYVWILIACFCGMACEKAVYIDIPYDGDKIVVNTLLQPDSLLYLRVTRSQRAGASVFPEIPGAMVHVRANAVDMPVQWQVIGGKGYFVSQTPVQYGARYSVEIMAAGLDTITATDTLPLKPLLSEPYAQAEGSRLRFKLKDLPGENYYRFNLYDADAQGRILKRASFRFDPSYNNNFTDLVSDRFIESTLIRDLRFDGQEITVVMQTKDVNTVGRHLVLEVTGLTSAAWQYLKSVEFQTDGSQNPLIDLPRVYTNVSKGYGIFAGVNSAQILVEIK